jgi:hypothetical protein
VDPPGQLHIGERAIALQLVQDAQVEGVELHEMPQIECFEASYAEIVPSKRFFGNSFRPLRPTVVG